MVAIDPSKEVVVSFNDLGGMIHRPVTASAVKNWVYRGRLSASGKLVKLESIRTHWGRGTSFEAYVRFQVRLAK